MISPLTILPKSASSLAERVIDPRPDDAYCAPASHQTNALRCRWPAAVGLEPRGRHLRVPIRWRSVECNAAGLQYLYFRLRPSLPPLKRFSRHLSVATL